MSLRIALSPTLFRIYAVKRFPGPAQPFYLWGQLWDKLQNWAELVSRLSEALGRARPRWPKLSLVASDLAGAVIGGLQRRPMGLLPFRCLFRQLAPLERSRRQQGPSSSGVGELG
jgi:hypothetical protein